MQKITKNSETKILKQAISAINILERKFKKYKNCCTWRIPAEEEERKNQDFKEAYEFDVFGDIYSVIMDLSVSPNYYYFTKGISFNGNESTFNKFENLKKKLLMELQERAVAGGDSGLGKTFSITHISNKIQNEGDTFKQNSRI